MNELSIIEIPYWKKIEDLATEFLGKDNRRLSFKEVKKLFKAVPTNQIIDLITIEPLYLEIPEDERAVLREGITWSVEKLRQLRLCTIQCLEDAFINTPLAGSAMQSIEDLENSFIEKHESVVDRIAYNIHNSIALRFREKINKFEYTGEDEEYPDGTYGMRMPCLNDITELDRSDEAYDEYVAREINK